MVTYHEWAEVALHFRFHSIQFDSISPTSELFDVTLVEIKASQTMFSSKVFKQMNSIVNFSLPLSVCMLHSQWDKTGSRKTFAFWLNFSPQLRCLYFQGHRPSMCGQPELFWAVRIQTRTSESSIVEKNRKIFIKFESILKFADFNKNIIIIITNSKDWFFMK